MLRTVLISIITFLFPAFGLINSAAAQTNNVHNQSNDSLVVGTSNASANAEPDDEFNIFLMLFGTIFLSIMLGGAAIGAFAATIILLGLFGLVSLGILSVSVITGLYHRSFQTGFKTLLIIICSAGGVILGAAAFWIVVMLFHLAVSNSTTFIAGAVSGGLGGAILGVIIFNLILLSSKYFKRQFQLLNEEANP